MSFLNPLFCPFVRYFRVSLSERRSTWLIATVCLFDFVLPSASPSVSFLFGFLARQEQRNFRRRVRSHFESTHGFFDASQMRRARSHPSRGRLWTLILVAAVILLAGVAFSPCKLAAPSPQPKVPDPIYRSSPR
jgi:hypothetical protein